MVEKFFHLYCFIIISIIIFYDFLYHDFWGLRLIYTAKQIQCGPELKKETDHLQIKQHGPINTAAEVERIDIRETHGSNSECLARDQPGCHLIYNFFVRQGIKQYGMDFHPFQKQEAQREGYCPTKAGQHLIRNCICCPPKNNLQITSQQYRVFLLLRSHFRHSGRSQRFAPIRARQSVLYI